MIKPLPIGPSEPYPVLRQVISLPIYAPSLHAENGDAQPLLDGTGNQLLDHEGGGLYAGN